MRRVVVLALRAARGAAPARVSALPAGLPLAQGHAPPRRRAHRLQTLSLQSVQPPLQKERQPRASHSQYAPRLRARHRRRLRRGRAQADPSQRTHKQTRRLPERRENKTRDPQPLTAASTRRNTKTHARELYEARKARRARYYYR